MLLLYLIFLLPILVVRGNDLATVLQQAAGVYKDAGSNKLNADLSKTVLITAANIAYLPFFHNFKCFLDRLGFKALMFSMDEKIHAELGKVGGDAIFSYYWNSGSGHATEGVALFATPQFHTITNKKKEGVLDVLRLGYDVIFADIDIALLRDPLPYLLWNNVDYVHSVNWICPHCDNWDFYKTVEEGNTGFYYVRSNSKTIKLFNDVKLEAPKYPSVDDQTIFWKWIRAANEPRINPLKLCSHQPQANQTELDLPVTKQTLTTCHLDGCVFSAGALRGVAYDWLKDSLKRKNEKAVSIHANYLKGMDKKMLALQHHRLWITEGNAKCKSFQPEL